MPRGSNNSPQCLQVAVFAIGSVGEGVRFEAISAANGFGKRQNAVSTTTSLSLTEHNGGVKQREPPFHSQLSGKRALDLWARLRPCDEAPPDGL